MTSDRLSVLVIDDDPGDAELLRRALNEIPKMDITFDRARTLNEARRTLAERSIDVIFLDYLLGADNGLNVLDQLHGSPNMGPVIAMTGQGDEYIACELMRRGADDYLPKRDLKPEALRRSIENATNRFQSRRLQALNSRLAEDLKKTNEALEQNNKRLAELYDTAHQFVDNVSHEFRTPLTVIKEFTAILADGLVGSVAPEQKEYLDTILDRVDELSTMIDDMLDISKLESGLFGVARIPCTVNDILERVRKTLLRKAASNRIRLEIPADSMSPWVYCDPEKIGRVLINLTVNAIKFSEENSEVRIAERNMAEDGVVRFDVIDHGPGIDPGKIAEIFERFRQLGGELRSSTKGFGLGLNIARELVHLNLGDITVASEIGKGSTFSFTVPSANPRVLIHRYLDRIHSFRQGSSCISLIVVRPTEKMTETQRTDLQRFIQHQIRKTDLVFPRSTEGWVIVAASNQLNISAMIRRIENGFVDANRNRPQMPLPPVSLEPAGSWTLPQGRVEFIGSFESEVPQESVRV